LHTRVKAKDKCANPQVPLLKKLQIFMPTRH